MIRSIIHYAKRQLNIETGDNGKIKVTSDQNKHAIHFLHPGRGHLRPTK